jgi:hypothetical protein
MKICGSLIKKFTDVFSQDTAEDLKFTYMARAPVNHCLFASICSLNSSILRRRLFPWRMPPQFSSMQKSVPYQGNVTYWHLTILTNN